MSKVTKIQIPELEEAPDIRYRRWSPEDKIILATYYGIKATKLIAQHFDRPIGQLHHMVGKLGISYMSTQKERDEIIKRIQSGEL